MRLVTLGKFNRLPLITDPQFNKSELRSWQPFCMNHPSVVKQVKSGRRSTWLRVYDGVLYLGIGDYGANTGPVDIAGVDINTGEPIVFFESTWTESLSPMKKIGDWLYTAWVDPRGVDSYYVTNEGGSWHEVKIPQMVHTFDIESSDGTDLLVCGSRIVTNEEGGTDAEACVFRQADRNSPWELVTGERTPGEGMQADGTWGTNDWARTYALIKTSRGVVWQSSSALENDPTHIFSNGEHTVLGDRLISHGVYNQDVVQAEPDGMHFWVYNDRYSVDDFSRSHLKNIDTKVPVVDTTGDTMFMETLFLNLDFYRYQDTRRGLDMVPVIKSVGTLPDGTSLNPSAVTLHNGRVYASDQDGNIWVL